MAKLEDIMKGFEPKLSEDYQPSGVPCSFETGAAGTGKTYQQQKAIEADINYGVLCATTGIAAVNLGGGATTLNSLLRFYDTNALRDNFAQGRLTGRLHGIGRKIKKIIIDEISMMDGRQLDILHQAILQVNQKEDMQDKPMGLVLTGDFCQLPPIKAPWAFEAECWEHFERNTNTLTKVWRQDNLEFLEAINAARRGQGSKCVEILKALKVKFIPQQEGRFPGTTIMSKNDQVDNFNFAALLEVPGEPFGLRRQTWGDLSGEWKEIPEMLKLKEGAYVMILANDPSGSLTYANGDCGWVQSKDLDGTMWIKLKRTEATVPVRPIVRHKTAKGDDAMFSLKKNFPGVDEASFAYDKLDHVFCDQKDCGISMPGLRTGATWGQPSFNCIPGSWNIGAVKYYPLRLAYATSVHKSQGLSLDNCQIDCRDQFFGQPSMGYVALSRCRTPEGLTIVGTPEKLAERIKIEPKVRRWL